MWPWDRLRCHCRHGTADVVILLKASACDIIVHVTSDVYKFEISLHLCGHSRGIACQFFPDVLFERCALPPALLLYLCVQVAGQCEGIDDATTAQRVSMHSMGIPHVDG